MAGMFFVVDPDKEVSPQHAAKVWEHLWAMRNLAPVGTMLPAMVSSPCPLLPDEPPGGVLVATLVSVPEESAWAPVEIDLLNYVNSDGRVRRSVLDGALRAAVEEGEQHHDDTHWGSPAQRRDSWLNRRLSIFVRGWGDVVGQSRADPESLAALREIQELADHIVAVLTQASRAIAAREGHCPALDVTGVQVQQHGREMNARWRRAIADNAVRHRNLLTLSPWDVFPRREPADFRYTNQHPLLASANSVSFCRDVDIGHWNIKEFKGFHERTNAILRHSGGVSGIAKQV